MSGRQQTTWGLKRKSLTALVIAILHGGGRWERKPPLVMLPPSLLLL